MGPTGVGKTAVALALGRELPIEVVSVDSRQVYRRMDIGTGKATPADRRRLPHHLVDVVEPDEPYDAARFVREAETAIAAIQARQRWPVLVGGTGLYLRALTRGLASRPPAHQDLRQRLRDEAAGSGESLHRRLATVDPGAAARLAPNDLVRVARALEVALLRGRPEDPSELRSWSTGRSRHPCVIIGLDMPRGALDTSLDARVDRMLQSGLIDEVAELLAAGFSASLPSMHGIGYRHLTPVVAGRARLADAVAAMKQDTRRYAKRQRTWFAHEPGIRWVGVDSGGIEEAATRIKTMLEQTSSFEYSG